MWDVSRSLWRYVQVCEARDEACSEQEPRASLLDGICCSTHLPDSGLSHCMLWLQCLLLAPLVLVTNWLSLLGSPFVSQPCSAYSHLPPLLQPGVENLCVAPGPWNPTMQGKGDSTTYFKPQSLEICPQIN